MAAVPLAAQELGIAAGNADPVYGVFGASIGDTDDDARQAGKAGVVSAIVKTGGQAIKHLDKIEAEKPHHLLRSFPDLCTFVRRSGPFRSASS